MIASSQQLSPRRDSLDRVALDVFCLVAQQMVTRLVWVWLTMGLLALLSGGRVEALVDQGFVRFQRQDFKFLNKFCFDESGTWRLKS